MYNRMTSNFMSEMLCGPIVQEWYEEEEEFDDVAFMSKGESLIGVTITDNYGWGDNEPNSMEDETKALLQECLDIGKWDDYIDSDSYSIPVVSTTPDNDGWVTVGVIPTEPKQNIDTRSKKWCKHQNACVWANCPYRHERCEHHDKWVASRGRTRGCRSHVTDPDSCKSPQHGGCQYDHRDLSKLRILHETLPCRTEDEMMMSFGDLGMDYLPGCMYDIKNMASYDKRLLLRSLNANKDLKHDLYEECEEETFVTINF